MDDNSILGRYAIYDQIAAGGMATVHIGRLIGPVGFARTVAIKRLHAQFARDPEFVSMFLDEARIAARVRHPNVVSTLDVVAVEGELFLVMEYIQGESLARLMKTVHRDGRRIPPAIVLSSLIGVLHGLHAAHEAKSEQGEPLGIVHRDVSPQNILVGVDGVARVFDFGIAKASSRAQTTQEGQIKGKFSYMAPEQLSMHPVDRRADIYSAAVVLWEALTGERLFVAENPMAIAQEVLYKAVAPPSVKVRELPRRLDTVVMRGLARDPAHRYATAREMAIALEDILLTANSREVGEWVERIAKTSLDNRSQRLAQIESTTNHSSAALTSLSPIAGSGAGLGDTEAAAGPTLQTKFNVTAATNTTANFTRTRRKVLAGALGAGVLSAIVFFGLLGRLRDGSSSTASPIPLAEGDWRPDPASAAVPRPDPGHGADLPIVTGTATPPTLTATPTATASATPTSGSATPVTSASAGPGPAAPPPRVRTVRQPPVERRPVAKPPSEKNCSPPYTITDGIRIPKPECL